MLKKLFSYLGTGLAIGGVVSPLCIALFRGLDGTLVQIFAWLGASAVFGLSSVIYDRESLSFPAAVALHGSLCLAVTLLTCALLGYGALFAGFGQLALRVLPTFLIIYAVICFAVSLYTRKSARDISRKLQAK